MKRAEITVFLNALTQLVMDGRIEEAARRFAPPMAVYFPEDVVIIKSLDQMEHRLTEYLRNCRHKGITRIEPSQLMIKDSTANRALVSLDLLHLDEGANLVCQSTVSYVLTRSSVEADIHVELVDFTRPSFPQMGRLLEQVVTPFPAERQDRLKC